MCTLTRLITVRIKYIYAAVCGPYDQFYCYFINIIESHQVTENNTSIISYTPVTLLDYGTLLCYAENDLGKQKEPCVLHIVPAGQYSMAARL